MDSMVSQLGVTAVQKVIRFAVQPLLVESDFIGENISIKYIDMKYDYC